MQYFDLKKKDLQKKQWLLKKFNKKRPQEVLQTILTMGIEPLNIGNC